MGARGIVDESVIFAGSVYAKATRNLLIVIFSIISYTLCGYTQDLVGPETTTLNLQGRLVVPGFIDSHVHLIFGGLQVLEMNLYSHY